MSREDGPRPSKVCESSGCGRLQLSGYDFCATHLGRPELEPAARLAALVSAQSEPARAEAPQGETHAFVDGPKAVCAQCGGPPDASAHPAAQPKTGDEARVRALERQAEAFAKYHAEQAAYGGASREFHERACGFLRGVVAAGRAAVLDSLETELKADLDHYAQNKHAREWIPHFLEAIAARRGSGT